jgi:hypothetical protein
MLITLPSGLLATDYWSPEELARQYEESRAIAGDFTIPTLPQEIELTLPDYMKRFTMAVEFLRSMQNDDTSSVKYGGMKEGEQQQHIVQTDNTQEAIWMWSRYVSLTGDTTYIPNIEKAWIYVMNFPSYNEEGGSGENGYYRIYNCGWAMAAEPEYRRVFGDSTYLWYSDSSANYVINNPLNLYGDPPYDILNGMITGWAAGTMHSFGESIGDTGFQSEAASLGLLVKEWAEDDPDPRLGGYNWAMSGGAAFWGVLNSYFMQHPEGANLWADNYVDYLQILVPDGNWQNAWNLWFTLGRYAGWDKSGNLTQKKLHQKLTNHFINLDGDNDGGMPANEDGYHRNDQSWVTSYLGFMGLTKLVAPADLVLIPDTTQVIPGSSLDFTGVVANNTDSTFSLDGWTEIYLPDGSPHPGNPIIGPVPFILRGRRAVTASFQYLVPSAATPGYYKYRCNTGVWPSEVIDSYDVRIEVIE